MAVQYPAEWTLEQYLRCITDIADPGSTFLAAFGTIRKSSFPGIRIYDAPIFVTMMLHM